MRARILIALAAVRIVGLVLPSSQAQRQARRFGEPAHVQTINPKLGIHTRLTDEVEERKIARTLRMVREMGAPWVVEYFPWAYIEPEKGRYEWTHADLVADYARVEGLTTIARLDYVPDWARPADTTSRYLGLARDDLKRAYDRAVAKLVRMGKERGGRGRRMVRRWRRALLWALLCALRVPLPAQPRRSWSHSP